MTAAPSAGLLALCAAIVGASGVGMGAFGAHALRAQVSAERLAAFQTGVLYQLLHAVALLALAAWTQHDARPLAAWVGGLWSVGILLFSGSLYALVLADMPRLGIVTPAGGLALIAGWALLGLVALRWTATAKS